MTVTIEGGGVPPIPESTDISYFVLGKALSPWALVSACLDGIFGKRATVTLNTIPADLPGYNLPRQVDFRRDPTAGSVAISEFPPVEEGDGPRLRTAITHDRCVSGDLSREELITFLRNIASRLAAAS